MDISITLIKYIAILLTIYIILRLVLNKDVYNELMIVLYTLAIVMVYVIFDILCGSKNESCNTVCMSKENMETLNAIQENIKQLSETEQQMQVQEATQQATQQASQQASQQAYPYVGQFKFNTTEYQLPQTAQYPSSSATNLESVPVETAQMGSCGTNVLPNEIQYTDYNHVPMGDFVNTGNFEYGYSFLPPDKWYPQPPFPPVCVTSNRCSVCPVYTSGAPTDIKEWNSSRRVTPPDNIKTEYITQKLNCGT